MSSIDFANVDIKKQYKLILKEEGFLTGLLSSLEKEYQSIIIKDILNNEKNIQLIIECDGIVINIDIDLENNRTVLKSPSWEYEMIYSNYVKRIYELVGKLYRKNNRSILKKYHMKINSIYDKMKSFELTVNNKVYTIIITEFKTKLNDKIIFDSLLDEDHDINCMIDIFKILNTILDINEYEIKISNLNEKGMMIVDRGKLTKYVEFREKENYKEKIYLENNEFFIEKTTKEKFDEEIPFVKKIGEKR